MKRRLEDHGSVVRALLVVVVALFLGAPLFAQTTPGDYTDERSLPAGARGEMIRAVLDALDSGEPAKLESLVKDTFAPGFRDRFPISEHVEALASFHDRSHGFDFYGVRRYADGGEKDREVVIVRNRLTGSWNGIVIHFDADARIAGLELLPARPPKDVPPLPPLTLEAAKAELTAFLDRLSAAEAFSGTVLLAKDGKVLYTAARGLADRNDAVPVRLDTKLNLGSMNKMFTAVVIAQLVEEGKLSFQDPVEKFLAGKVWTKADLSKVRIEHLLTHTSGLGSYFNETWQHTARQFLRRVDDYKPLVAEETLAFEPGTRWQYSNTGFLLLGAVIEAVTGQDYFDVVRERVYARAGMPNSDCYDIDLVVPSLGVGYSRERTADGVRWRANTFEHVIRGGPAGGGYSTVEDLLAFSEALRHGRLVSPAMLERLTSPKPEVGSPEYGYGFGVGLDALGRRAGHTGGFSGISSVLDVYLDSGWTMAVLSNTDDGMPPVSQKLRELAGRIR
jgi:CubicO group peptidase (beta-lactamase class C family)